MNSSWNNVLSINDVRVIDEQKKFSFFFIPNYVEHLSDCWEKVLHLGEKHFYRKGETFILDHGFAYIKSGLVVSFFQEFEDLKYEIRSFIGSGCLIKDTYSGANYDHFPSQHNCIYDTELYIFDNKIIYNQNFINKHSDLIQNYIYSISAKSLSNWAFCSLSKQTSNSQKLAYYLYGFYLLCGKNKEFTPPFSQKHLAFLLGLDIMTVNRIINCFKKQGILACWTKKHIRLLDIKKLEQLKFCKNQPT